MRTALALAAGLVCAAGCRTTTVEHPFVNSVAEVQHAAPSRAWTIVIDGMAAGRVVLFENEGRPEASIYMVQNAWDQDLGMIDSLGRAWRYQPHEREAAWVGTGTVAYGAARILGISDTCSLLETAIDDALASLAAAPAR